MSNSDAKSPAELRAERFAALRGEWDRLHSRASLEQLQDGIEDTAGKVDALPHQIAEYRSRGYRYGGDWEARAETMGESWPERRREARRILRQKARGMGDLAEEIEELCGYCL